MHPARGSILAATLVVALQMPATARAGDKAAVAPVPFLTPELVSLLDLAGRSVVEYEQGSVGLAGDAEATLWTRMADSRLGPAAAGLHVGEVTVPVEGAAPSSSPPIACDAKSGWCQRTTRADFVLASLPGEARWGVFLDVYEVDLQKVRNREPRLERLFASMPVASAEPQARGLLEDGDARYRIGTVLRDIANPALGFVVLHPRNRSRFVWKLGGTRRFADVEGTELLFEETAEPTLASWGRAALPASGRLWIDPAHGTLLRCEATFRLEPQQARAQITTEFRFDPKLESWVPSELQEAYEDLATAGEPVFFSDTKATTRFSGFHRIGSASIPGAPGSEPREAATSRVYSPELVQLLQRAGAYVAEYERSFSNLVVEETYTQDIEVTVTRTERTGPHGALHLDPSQNTQEDYRQEFTRVPVTEREHRRQTTRADLVFVRLAGEFPWASYRDVFEVNGHEVRARDERLVKLLSNPPPDAPEQARKLLAASAAYNIGRVQRTVNLPTLPLMFLLPDNQQRFAFRVGERKTIASTEVVELQFEETSRPTLIRGPRAWDLPSKGHFWLSPTRGTVVRSDVEFDFGPEAEATETTDYRPDPALAMWVPIEMKERYVDLPEAKVKTFPERLTGRAQYARFRRFTVSTQEELAAEPQ